MSLLSFLNGEDKPVRLEKPELSWSARHPELLTKIMLFLVFIAVTLFFYMLVFWVISPIGSYNNFMENLGGWV